MERQTALVLSIIFFALFFLLTYYGARVKFYSSLVFSVFISLTILNIFYPISNAVIDVADFTLIVYGLVQILGINILATYIIYKTLSDVRTIECINNSKEIENVY